MTSVTSICHDDNKEQHSLPEHNAWGGTLTADMLVPKQNSACMLLRSIHTQLEKARAVQCELAGDHSLPLTGLQQTCCLWQLQVNRTDLLVCKTQP